MSSLEDQKKKERGVQTSIKLRDDKHTSSRKASLTGRAKQNAFGARTASERCFQTQNFVASISRQHRIMKSYVVY